MTRAVLVVISSLLLAAASSGQFALPTKSVAAPPEEIAAGHLRLPDPSDAAVRSVAALLPVDIEAGATWEQTVPVEAGGRLDLVPLVGVADAWQVEVAEPGGDFATLAAWVSAGRAGASTEGVAPWMPAAQATRYALSTSQTGRWSLRVTAGSSRVSGALLMAHAAPDATLVTQPSHWDLTTVGRPALRARVESTRGALLLEASAHVAHASGARWVLPMFDDGRHDDLVAGDGVFGVFLPTTHVGSLDVRVEARGLDVAGEFLRTTQQSVSVHGDVVRLRGTATSRAEQGRLLMMLSVDVDDVDRPLHVSAEVWGANGSGDVVPVAWLSTMTTARVDGAATLALDGRWLARAGVTQSLELRHVRIQDPDTHIPLTRADVIDLPAPVLPRSAYEPPEPMDAAMLTGYGFALAGSSFGTTGASSGSRTLSEPGVPKISKYKVTERALMLVHGYCSSLMWDPGDFSGKRIVFMDPDANRSHDEFAQLIGTAGLEVDSFGVVAHSQGGQAALHLLTYYMSALDLAEGPRRIQSVGTPYQGTPLAGSLASLGAVFGQGCGVNDDLAPAGSTLWLAGIPMWARAEVHYWTTSTGGFWCNFATNLVLSNPEDGVVEQSRAQLVGGNSEGHKTGWCHTTGMNDPAQYNDQSRNSEMDAQAAR